MVTRHSGATGTGWLVCLLLATFVIGTDDFIIAGLLPEIAADLGVGEAAAGQLVTVFSITYAVAAPPIAVATARLPRKLLVVGGLTVFAILNLVTALAPSYISLMVLRALAALVAATITPAAFAMAGRLAAPDRVGRAMGMVAAGLTISLFVGVPTGSLLGSALGWRSTFVAVAFLTTAVVLACAALLPPLPGAREIGVGEQLRILSRPAVLTCVLGTVTGAPSGLYVGVAVAGASTGRGRPPEGDVRHPPGAPRRQRRPPLLHRRPRLSRTPPRHRPLPCPHRLRRPPPGSGPACRRAGRLPVRPGRDARRRAVPRPFRHRRDRSRPR